MAGAHPGQWPGGFLSWAAVAWRVSILGSSVAGVLYPGSGVAGAYPGQERGGCLSWAGAWRLPILGSGAAGVCPGQERGACLSWAVVARRVSILGSSVAGIHPRQ